LVYHVLADARNNFSAHLSSRGVGRVPLFGFDLYDVWQRNQKQILDDSQPSDDRQMSGACKASRSVQQAFSGSYDRFTIEIFGLDVA
jgi:hypothetical protein